MSGHERKGDSLRVKEFTKENSQHLGCVFFVCDYRIDVRNEKAFRNLKPTEAMLISVDDYKKGCEAAGIKPKQVYFSQNVFVQFSPKSEYDHGKKCFTKGGLNFKKHLPIFDNTGSSASLSCALFILEDKDSAVKKYRELLDIAVDDFTELLQKFDKRIKYEIARINKEKEDIK